MNARFHCAVPLAAGASVELPQAAAHHAQRVLRLGVGAPVTLFNGDGGEYLGRIASLERSVLVELSERADIEREAPLSIRLAQVVPAGERMDWVVQKATELGVAAIRPLHSSRSVVRLEGARADRRREHWRQVAIAACEQCGRNRLPDVGAVATLPHYLGEPAGPAPARLVLAPEAVCNLSQLPAPGQEVDLLVGPEGGFTDDEIKAARLAGFQPVRLGPRVLRSDTAGLAAIAALLARWGDF